MALATNLVAYYKLDESSGNAADSIGSNTLTNNNTVTYTTAKINNGASGGASNTNKDLSIANNLGITNGAMSMSFWVKNITEIGGAYYGFVTKGDSGTNVIYSVLYSYNGGTRQLWFVRRKNGTSDNSIFYNVTMGTSNWYHIVMTYDGTTLEGYVNGTSIGTVAASGNGSSGAASQLNILSFADSGALHQQLSSSLIDEVGIWSRQLTSSEVTALYNAGSGVQYPFNTAYTQSVVESVTVSEVYSTVFGHAKSIAESITIGEALIKAITRNIAESITATGTASGTKVIVGAVADGIIVSDTYSYIRGYAGNVIETITPSDARTIAMTKRILESVTISEAILVSRLYLKNVLDSITMADALATTSVRAVRILENITITETLGVLKNGIVVSLRFFAKYAANAISTAKKYFSNP